MRQYDKPFMRSESLHALSNIISSQQYTASLTAIATGESCDGGPVDTEGFPDPAIDISAQLSTPGGQILVAAIKTLSLIQETEETDPDIINNGSATTHANGAFEFSSPIVFVINDRGCDFRYSVTAQGNFYGEHITATAQATNSPITPSDPDCIAIVEGTTECTRYFTIEGSI